MKIVALLITGTCIAGHICTYRAVVQADLANRLAPFLDLHHPLSLSKSLANTPVTLAAATLHNLLSNIEVQKDVITSNKTIKINLTLRLKWNCL